MSEHNMIHYEETCASFEWERPENYNFAQDVIDHWANRDPKKQALFWVDDAGNEETRTFQEISSNSKKLCNALFKAGVQRGDTIILILGREISWWEIFTAALRMGSIISPGTTQLSSKDIEYRIQAAAATCIITNSANSEKVEKIALNCPSLTTKLLTDGEKEGWINYQKVLVQFDDNFPAVNTSANDEAMCYFTSGTTGYPKMTIHTHSYAIGHKPTGQ